MGYMKARDAINGQEGVLKITRGASTVGGLNLPAGTLVVAECKNITAKITKNKSQFKALGYRGVQHKANGWSGSGTMTLYYVTSYWSEILENYATYGYDEYFTLQFTNYDPTSQVGTQIVTLTDVNLDDIELAKLDVDAEFLDVQVNFTFSGFSIDTPFGALPQTELVAGDSLTKDVSAWKTAIDSLSQPDSVTTPDTGNPPIGS